MPHREKKTPWGFYFFIICVITGTVAFAVEAMQGGGH